MYKRATRNLLHAHRVSAPLPTGGYIGAAADSHDVIPSAHNMSLSDVQEEQRRIRGELLRLEADLAAAKAIKNRSEVTRLGQAIQVLAKRMGPLKARAHTLIRQDYVQALGDAIKELCDPDLAKALFQRAHDIANHPISEGACDENRSISRIEENRT